MKLRGLLEIDREPECLDPTGEALRLDERIVAVCHLNAHECQCSLNQPNSSAPQVKKREWVAR